MMLPCLPSFAGSSRFAVLHDALTCPALWSGVGRSATAGAAGSAVRAGAVDNADQAKDAVVCQESPVIIDIDYEAEATQMDDESVEPTIADEDADESGPR